MAGFLHSRCTSCRSTNSNTALKEHLLGMKTVRYFCLFFYWLLNIDLLTYSDFLTRISCLYIFFIAWLTMLGRSGLCELALSTFFGYCIFIQN